MMFKHYLRMLERPVMFHVLQGGSSFQQNDLDGAIFNMS